MIEKFENANNAESTTIYSEKGSGSSCYFCWGGYDIDQSGITSYTQVGGGSSNLYGYLYLDNSGLNISPSTWSTGALSDFAGKNNSVVIKGITNNGSSSSLLNPMAYLLNAFNSTSCPKSVNQGCTDWFIPSCGQLGLIWLNKAALNNALTSIGGTALSANFYLTSSENSSKYSWVVELDNGGIIGYYDKGSAFQVRLVRDL